MTATWADPTATWADWSTSWTGTAVDPANATVAQVRAAAQAAAG